MVKLDELPDYMVGPDLPNTIRREFTKQLPAFVQRVRVELAREARR